MARRFPALLGPLAALAVVASLGGGPASGGPDDGFAEKRRVYDLWVKRPSFDKRTTGRARFAATGDPRARDVLMASYDRPEAPEDQVKYTIVSIVARQFTQTDSIDPFAAWRASHGKAEDAWLWYRTLDAHARNAGHASILEAARSAPDPCLRAAALAALDTTEDVEALRMIPALFDALAKDAFERALAVEAAAEVLVSQAAWLGREEFHDPAMRVIMALDDLQTPPRSRLVIGRCLARLFDKPAVVLDAKYWRRLLQRAESQDAETPVDDRYVQPPAPTFAGVAATGKRVVYVIDLSDSMLAPISVREVEELIPPKPKQGPLTGNGGGSLPPEPEKPEDPTAPAPGPLGDEGVDWKKVKTRFDAARELLKASIRALPEDASFAVVGFGTKADLLKSTPGMTAASAAAAKRVGQELAALKIGRPGGNRPYGTLLGATNLHGALRRAFRVKETGLFGPYEYVRSATFFEGCDTMFILSDGAPSLSDWVTGDRRDPDDHAGDPESGTPMANTDSLNFHGPYSRGDWIADDVRRLNLLRRVEIHCVGIGEASGGLLREIADLGHGQLRTIVSEPPPVK